jgi:hypothetical protein
LIGVVISAAVILWGGVCSVLRWSHRRKKNRIDVYYRRMLAIERRVQRATGSEERQSLNAEIERLKHDAFDELIRESLSADESFTIFIRLVDRSLDSLQRPPPGLKTSDAPNVQERTHRIHEACRSE